jgi:hypothetical protein
MSVCFSKLDKPEQDKLLQVREECKSKFIQKLQKDDSFWDSITTGTATKDSVQKRHKLFKAFLIDFIL